MANNIQTINFHQLISELGIIRIPQIQRDYVQGRLNQTTSEIRKNFVRELLKVVIGHDETVHLDFVYGSQQSRNEIEALEPLDGQQRLTTLFLLHWILCDKQLITATGKSVLTYTTRETSADFCDEIVKYSCKEFITEAEKKTAQDKSRYEEIVRKKNDNNRLTDEERYFSPKEYKASDIIMKRGWFLWSWKYDPTIKSMLVMIDDIISRLNKHGFSKDDFESLSCKLDKITFDMLNIHDLGMSDELYVKMNSRGKELSKFDILKSTLEEEIQLQKQEATDKKETVLMESVETEWRDHIDGKWLNYFWQQYAVPSIQGHTSNTPEDRAIRLQSATDAEEKMRLFVLRMIAMQIIEQTSDESLRELGYNLSNASLDEIIPEYQDNLADWRCNSDRKGAPTGSFKINFKQLIDDFNLLIRQRGSSIFDVTQHIDSASNLEANDSGKTYLQMFVDDKDVKKDGYVIWIALMLYLRLDSRKYEDTDQWRNDLTNFMKFIRNCLLNENNIDQIDKYYKFIKTYQSLKILIGYFDNSKPISECILSIDRTFPGIDNQSLAEEKGKAQMRLSGWGKLIDDAESNTYLWGQIRCLIRWADNDQESFKRYTQKLIELLQYGLNDECYVARLIFDPQCWHSDVADNRLFVFTNKDKYNSAKRCLRSTYAKVGQTLGDGLKSFIDSWSDDLSIENYCNQLIQQKCKSSVYDWVWTLAKFPDMIRDSSMRRLYENKGHVILPQGSTLDSHCYDPVLWCLCILFDNHFLGKNIASPRFEDSKSENHTHRITYKVFNHEAYCEWDTNLDGGYILVTNKSDIEHFNDSNDLIHYFIEKELPKLDIIYLNQGVNREGIKELYPGLEGIVDLLIDNQIDFNHEGETDLLGEGDIVLATAAMIIKSHKIAIEPMDDNSEKIFKAAGYKVVSKDEFSIDLL